MSIVPFREPRRRPKRQPLSQAEVVRAALELLDEAGLDELTMRGVAGRLGVKAASLYRHVRDKYELLVLLGDEISGQIPLDLPSGGWRRQIAAMAWNVRRGLLAHRDAARLLATTPPFGPHRLRQVETLLGILRSAGLSSREAARAAYHCNNFVTEFAADEARFAAFASGTGSTRRKILAKARKHFRSLSTSEYPRIVEMADDLSENDPDALFQFGLDVWLSGLERLSRRSGR